MIRVKLFISSPGNVAEERQRAFAVVERLQQEFGDTLSLEPLLYEPEPQLATAARLPHWAKTELSIWLR